MLDKSPSYKNIWTISYPIILSLVAQNVINVTNTAFLGRVGEVELGASAIAGLFYVVLYMIGFGFTTGTQIIIARRNGERNFKEIGSVFDQSLWFLLVVSFVLFFVIKYGSPYVLKQIIHSQAIYEKGISFLNIRIWGIMFAFGAGIFRAFYVGITRTRLLTWSAIIMAVVNIILDYCLIFGNFGFPKMGLEGAAIASVCAEAVSTIFFIIPSITAVNMHKYGIFRFPKPDFKVIYNILELSFPIMLQYVVSLSAWFVFFLIIERMGEHSLAISNIVRSIYMVLMIPVWAFCSTTSTLVSNAIGEGNSNHVGSIIKKNIVLSVVFTLLLVIPSVIIPAEIISIYTNNQQLIADSVPSLYVISGALILFAISMIIFSGVSGTGNTMVALIFETATIAMYLFSAWLFTSVFFHEITTAWLAEYVYYIFIGLTSIIYMRSGHWRKKRI